MNILSYFKKKKYDYVQDLIDRTDYLPIVVRDDLKLASETSSNAVEAVGKVNADYIVPVLNYRYIGNDNFEIIFSLNAFKAHQYILDGGLCEYDDVKEPVVTLCRKLRSEPEKFYFDSKYLCALFYKRSEYLDPKDRVLSFNSDAYSKHNHLEILNIDIFNAVEQILVKYYLNKWLQHSADADKIRQRKKIYESLQDKHSEGYYE